MIICVVERPRVKKSMEERPRSFLELVVRFLPMSAVVADVRVVRVEWRAGVGWNGMGLGGVGCAAAEKVGHFFYMAKMGQIWLKCETLGHASNKLVMFGSNAKMWGTC